MNHSKKTVFQSAVDFKGGSLAMCLEKIAEHRELLHIVRAAIPPRIAEHANYCMPSGSLLLVYTDSAVWASQIRFFNVAILNKLQESGQQKITQVRVKVLAPVAEQMPRRAVQLPSQATVGAMLAQVDETTADVLGAALSRLAKALQKRLDASDETD